MFIFDLIAVEPRYSIVGRSCVVDLNVSGSIVEPF
jgi:hypothetical protein